MAADLIVTEIEIERFRSYQSLTLSLDPRITVLVGRNAVGKTNIIEALELVTAAESFRRPTWRDLITWGEGSTRITLSAEGVGRVVEISLTVDQENGKRDYQVNGSRKKRVSEVKGILPSVLFTPNDLSLVKGPAENRRLLVDALGGQLSAVYESLRKEYSRVVRQRNSALKNGLEETLIHSFDTTLVALGGKFTGHRARLVGKVKKHAEGIYNELTGGESLEIQYLTPWSSSAVDPTKEEEVGRAIQEQTNRMASEERARKTTLCGPHKDDILFLIDGRPSREFGSQGQQRTVALAWKLAEVEVISEVAGVAPLLLLDDVMSELDGSRRTQLARVAGLKAQTVFTTTNIGYFDDELLSRAQVVDLS